MNSEELRQRSAQLLEEQPNLRTLNLADALGVKERDLVQAQCAGIESVYLGEDAKALFKRLLELGEVMALTRNPWCVHERHGVYESVGIGKSDVGLVLGSEIDLRMFFDRWGTIWEVNQKGHRSLQFFDKHGVAIHKIYATDATNKEAFDALVTDFRQPEYATIPALEPAAPTPSYDPVPDTFRAEWLALKDTHDFHPLLKKHNVKRVEALAAAGEDLAQQVPIDTVEKVLEQVAADELPMMCFVANQSMVQIHGGLIKNIKRTGSWYNVLDPRFNLHLNTEAIASLWVVNKPTEDGWVTSLEAYTDKGNLIVQFFGLRKPGIPENKAWRELLASHCTTPLAQ